MKKLIGTILGFLCAVIFPFGIFQLAVTPSNVFPFDFLSEAAYRILLNLSLFPILETLSRFGYFLQSPEHFINRLILPLVWIAIITYLSYWLSKSGKFFVVRNTFAILLVVAILIPSVSQAIILNRQFQLKNAVSITCPPKSASDEQKIQYIVFDCEVKVTRDLENLTLLPYIFIQPEAGVTKNQKFPSVSLGYRFKNIYPERSTMLSPFNLVDNSGVQAFLNGSSIKIEQARQKVFLVIPRLSQSTHALKLSIPSSIVSEASWKTFHYGIEETGRQFVIARLDFATHKNYKDIFYNKDFGFVYYLYRTEPYDLSVLTSASPITIARGCMDAFMAVRPHVTMLKRCLSAENLERFEAEGFDIMIGRWNSYFNRCFLGDAGEYTVEVVSSDKVRIKISSDYLKEGCKDEIDMVLENGEWKFDQRL